LKSTSAQSAFTHQTDIPHDTITVAAGERRDTRGEADPWWRELADR